MNIIYSNNIYDDNAYRRVLLKLVSSSDDTLAIALTFAMCNGYRDVIIDLINTHYVGCDVLTRIVEAGYSRGQVDLARYIEEKYLCPAVAISNGIQKRLDTDK